MKIFLDTAHVPSIKKYAEMGIIDGITTNPSHLSKEGSDPRKVIKEISALLPHGDISVEVTEKEPQDVYKQAHEIAKIAGNITVKVPCHDSYYAIIKQLVEDGISVNVTLLFTLIQGLYMSKLGATYISPFIGRLDDIDEPGIHVIGDLRSMIDRNKYKTLILAASIRSVRHFHDCIIAGAHVITLPLSIFEESIKHPLTERGMELFDNDWKKLGVKQFP